MDRSGVDLVSDLYFGNSNSSILAGCRLGDQACGPGVFEQNFIFYHHHVPNLEVAAGSVPFRSLL